MSDVDYEALLRHVEGGNQGEIEVLEKRVEAAEAIRSLFRDRRYKTVMEAWAMRLTSLQRELEEASLAGDPIRSAVVGGKIQILKEMLDRVDVAEKRLADMIEQIEQKRTGGAR